MLLHNGHGLLYTLDLDFVHALQCTFGQSAAFGCFCHLLCFALIFGSFCALCERSLIGCSCPFECNPICSRKRMGHCRFFGKHLCKTSQCRWIRLGNCYLLGVVAKNCQSTKPVADKSFCCILQTNECVALLLKWCYFGTDFAHKLNHRWLWDKEAGLVAKLIVLTV